MSEVGTPLEEAQENEAEELPRNEYYFRLLVSVAAASTLVSHITWGEYGLKFYFFILWIVYPNVAFLITKKNTHRLRQITRIFSAIDAFLLGSLITIINFSLLPAILFLTIIQCQALITGGTRKLIEDISIFIFAMAIALIYHDAHFMPMSDISGSLPSLIGISFYFVIYSFFIYKQIYNVRIQAHSLHAEQQALKMKTWKVSRYVSPQVWKTIFSGHDSKLETKRKQLTVFFSDIKGFSDLSEQLEPEALNTLLSQYLTEMSHIVHKHGGTIDKFIGDAIMVFFGDPSSKGAKQDAIACVSMAIEMKRKMKDLQQKWHSEGITQTLEIRMGINSGYCTVGSFGTEQRLDYTVLGTEVNLASRLESAAPPGEILVSYETHSLIKDTIMCRDKGKIKVKGFSEPVQVFLVTDYRKNTGSSQTFFEQRTDGFFLYADLDKIKNYDREKITKALLGIATKLKNKVN